MFFENLQQFGKESLCNSRKTFIFKFSFNSEDKAYLSTCFVKTMNTNE